MDAISTSVRSRVGLVGAFMLSSCGPEGGGHETTNRPAQIASGGSSATATGAPPSASGATSGAVAPSSPLAGRWSGELESKKAEVSLDKGVKDKALADDKGQIAAGKGSIEIDVAPDGTVTGTVKGALGPGTLAGTVDEDRITASLVPDDPTAEHAMSGTLVLDPAQSGGGPVQGLLRASSGSGEIVRVAPVTLKRSAK